MDPDGERVLGKVMLHLASDKLRVGAPCIGFESRSPRLAPLARCFRIVPGKV
jgi:hypothetical protein